MAILTIRDRNEIISHLGEIDEFLGQYGIWYRRFEGCIDVAEGASDSEILGAYGEPIQKLMAVRGFQSADVVTITPETPGLEEMVLLRKGSRLSVQPVTPAEWKIVLALGRRRGDG